MFESWPVALYRGGKLLAGGLFALPFEVFVHDRGDEGNNGKTVLQTISAAIAGDYHACIADSMLQRRPPNPSAPDPALFALIGRRLLGTPEVEDDIKVQSAWVKKLADPATIWAAREPYAASKVDFKLAALFTVSTNAKLHFSRMDGGVQRRGIGCNFPFVFGPAAEPGTNQRINASWNLKDTNLIRAYIPGFYMFLETTLKVWYSTGYHRVPSTRVPLLIAEATKALCEEELKSIMEDVCQQVFKTTTDTAEAITHRNALKLLLTDASVTECSKDPVALRHAADMLLKPCTVRGSRLCKLGGRFMCRADM